MARRELARRLARATALVVGEGHAEVAFIKHLRGLYTGGHAGFAVTVHNARGFGAGHVIEQTIRQSRLLAYDHRVALFDTDAGWTEAVQVRARRNRIVVVPSTPCLEAWLLDVVERAGERDTLGHKAEFERRFGCVANDPRALANFPREVLDESRLRVATLDLLLTSMGVGPAPR